MKKRTVITIVIGGVAFALVCLNVLLVIVVHYCEPRTYVKRLKVGMPYTQVSSTIPRRLIAADLHPISDSKFVFGRKSVERKGIKATRMMVLEDTLWPITQASVCFLYFDDEDRLVYWFVSSS